MYVCMCVCIHLYVHIHTYIDIYVGERERSTVGGSSSESKHSYQDLQNLRQYRKFVH